MGRIGFLIAAVLACCVAFGVAVGAEVGELPPDVGAELAEARAAWHKAEDLTMAISRLGGKAGKEYDTTSDARDAAHQQTIEMYRLALKKDPSNPHALAEFGRYWLWREEYYVARQYLENAWASQPRGPSFERRVTRRLAELAATCGMVAAAPFAREAMVTPERCGSRAENAFSEPEKADLLRALGGTAERAGESGLALAYYRAAFARNPVDPRNRVSLAVGLCATGNTADVSTLLEPWALAPDAAEKAAADFPKERFDILALGLFTLAVAKEELGAYEDALALYKRVEAAAKNDPLNAAETAENARMSRARLEDKLDEFAANEIEAEKELKNVQAENERRKTVPLKPNEKRLPPLSEPPKSDRANFAYALNFCWHAASMKQQAMRDPDFVEGVQKLWFNQIKAKELESTAGFNLFQSAESTLQASVNSFPRFSRAYYELALCELQMHRYATARTLLDAAALYNPNDVATLSLRGTVLLDLGQWEEAAGVFRKVVALDAENGAAYFGLGRALTALKSSEAMCAEAVDAFSRAKKLGVRDERIDVTRSLNTKDGQTYAGHILDDGDDYIVMEEGAAPFRIAKKEIKEEIKAPGLKQQANDTRVRYSHGEKPPVVTRYGRQKHYEDEVPLLQSPDGSIFGGR